MKRKEIKVLSPVFKSTASCPMTISRTPKKTYLVNRTELNVAVFFVAINGVMIDLAFTFCVYSSTPRQCSSNNKIET